MSNTVRAAGQRTQALTERFEQANEELIATVEGFSDTQWTAVSVREGWPVSVIAHHVAENHLVLAGVAVAVAAGEPAPALSWEMIDQFNAQHAAHHTTCARQETIELLRSRGAAAANMIRDLCDEQLDRSTAIPWEGGRPMSAQHLIEEKLIGHIPEHLASIHAAL